MNNVLCMKWGSKYGPDYVNILHAMVARHLEPPVRFICLTDDRTGIDPAIECRALPDIELGGAAKHHGWRKFSVFSPELHDLAGRVLFHDLDLVIVDRLGPFFDLDGRFCIIENWPQAGQGIGNSSVFRFEAGDYADVFERFCRDSEQAVRTFPNSQTFMSHLIQDKTWWPDAWCRSYKRHCLSPGPLKAWVQPKLPEGTRIVVFHGQPKPPDAAVGIWPGKRRRIRGAPWIAEHWH